MKNTLAGEVSVSPDGKRLDFVMRFPRRAVMCSIAREALELHFWMSTGASGTRLQKAYLHGYNRIKAAAERKMPVVREEPVNLGIRDFSC